MSISAAAGAKGEYRFIQLLDGTRVKLVHDFNSIMAHEREFNEPLRTQFSRIQDQLSKPAVVATDGTPEDPGYEATSKDVFAYAERMGIRLEYSSLERQAQWAYALGETWREDNEDPGNLTTWPRFRRNLPSKPGDMLNWSTAVTAVLMGSLGEPKKPEEEVVSPTSSASEDQLQSGGGSSIS